ncbi:MAG: dihydrofolate reductase family protein [Bacilli bacterium]|nr:dihydrofolate reductase family protein [Bacilli bacterium]
MNRPYIICHMLVSIDGKVTGSFLSKEAASDGVELYYEKNRTINSKGFICGRVTMEESFTNKYYPDLSKYQNVEIEKTDYVVDNSFEKYAVAFDRFGRLGWQNSVIVDEDPGYNKAHIIEVLTENVKGEYLAYLQEIKVSYIFAGKDELSVGLALEKLKTLFNIDKLLLEGGSIINGAFLKEDLVDELSLVYVPLIGEKEDKPLFYNSEMTNFELISSDVFKNNIYARYKVKR